jgi:hypothetical protein
MNWVFHHEKKGRSGESSLQYFSGLFAEALAEAGGPNGI